jgi:hypothetical protein
MKDLPKDSHAQVAYIASDIKTQGPYSLKKIPRIHIIISKFIERSLENSDKIRYWSSVAKYNFVRYLLNKKGG